MSKDREARLLGMLGLCRRAGKLVMGTDMVCEAMAAKKAPHLVCVSASASGNTRKKITTKSEFYGIPRLELPVTPEQLGSALGKSGGIASVAVLDAHFAGALTRIESTGKEPSGEPEDEE